VRSALLQVRKVLDKRAAHASKMRRYSHFYWHYEMNFTLCYISPKSVKITRESSLIKDGIDLKR
jgi:Na+-transporting NADH:ubiquinone oxidoreductase subunit NqrB